MLLFTYLHRRYDEEVENAWGCASWFEYLMVIILSAILLIGALVLTLFWTIFYRGGYAWSEDPKLQFNLHPVLMVGGFITLSGFCEYIQKKCMHWTNLIFFSDLRSHFAVSIVSMPEAYLRKIGTHPVPCVHHSVCGHRIFGRVWFAQFGQSANSEFLFAAFVVGTGDDGSVCVAICFWIFHVSTVLFFLYR